jgi:hypothetical protein
MDIKIGDLLKSKNYLGSKNYFVSNYFLVTSEPRVEYGTTLRFNLYNLTKKRMEYETIEDKYLSRYYDKL